MLAWTREGEEKQVVRNEAELMFQNLDPLFRLKPRGTVGKQAEKRTSEITWIQEKELIHTTMATHIDPYLQHVDLRFFSRPPETHHWQTASPEEFAAVCLRS